MLEQQQILPLEKMIISNCNNHINPIWTRLWKNIMDREGGQSGPPFVFQLLGYQKLKRDIWQIFGTKTTHYVRLEFQMIENATSLF